MARLHVDEVVTTYTMDPSGYLKGVKQVTAANDDLQASHKKSGGKGFLNFSMSDFDPISAGAKLAGGAIAGVTAAVAGLAFGAKKAFEEFANFDSMTKALESVEGGAQKAKLAMEDLRQIAKAPGIGFQESVQAYVQLRGAGNESEFSKKLIKEIANANARSGGSVETFSQAMLAVSQISMKPFLQGQELLQLMNAGIPASKIVKDKFGTADPEELKKKGITSSQVLAGVLQELEKLPRVAGGAQNSIDNFVSAIQMVEVSIGGALAGAIGGSLDALSAAMEKANEAGVFADGVTHFASAIGLVDINATSAKDGIINLVAGFMTLGDQIEIFKANIEGFIELVKSAVDMFMMPSAKGLIQAITGWDIGAWASGKPGNDEPGVVGGSFGNHVRELTMEWEKNNGGRHPKIHNSDAGKDSSTSGGFAGSSHPESVNYLKVIAENTNPLREIASQILGGGSLTKHSLNRQDLSDLKSGRSTRGGDPIERAVWDLVGAVKASVIGDGYYSRQQG